LGSLGVAEGASVLDVGTGFGPIPLELAGMTIVDALGVDTDTVHLGVARELAGELAEAGWLRRTSTVSFAEGDAYDLPVDDEAYDLASSRLLYQHLAEPARAASELFRVVKPGGGVCVIDVDEGLAVSYPEPSKAFQRLQLAFRELQESKGGDRRVGRKLSTYMEQAGFDILSVVMLPQSFHGPSSPGDASRTFALERLHSVRDDAVAAGVIGAEEFDTAYSNFATEDEPTQCVIEAHLAVVAKKPLG
jgi:ubiquinone/menaquinone biosynthesis C-methylase UbiE